MKILLLGPYNKNIIEHLESYGDEVLQSENRILPSEFLENDYDFIISYSYRYIIPKSVVDFYENRLINLHISYLPWNKGADPNLWSFIEDTPKGVTIHYVDEGLDTGDIIAQREVIFGDGETLASTYDKLTNEIEKLLIENWSTIRIGRNKRVKQSGIGSYHRLRDKEDYMHLIADDWSTPVRQLINALKRGKVNE